MVIYAAKIGELIAKMFAILPNIRPLNKSAVNAYLGAVYPGVISLQSAVADCTVNNALQEKFQTYIDSEEARLQANLEAVDYDIDAADTLVLVTGPGRIEKVCLDLRFRSIR
jgi:uncharacterized glyoxalase superfamily metalloenzyme YdcJ